MRRVKSYESFLVAETSSAVIVLSSYILDFKLDFKIPHCKKALLRCLVSLHSFVLSAQTAALELCQWTSELLAHRNIKSSLVRY